MVLGAAPSKRARAIVPCRLILAVVQPWLQHACPRCTGSHARSAWYLHRWATAPQASLGAGAHFPSSAPSRHGVRCRAVPARARYCACYCVCREQRLPTARDGALCELVRTTTEGSRSQCACWLCRRLTSSRRCNEIADQASPREVERRGRRAD